MKVNRNPQERQEQGHGRHAVVIGGSLGGLLAARVLSYHFEQVTILERDAVQDKAEARKGQPHVRHTHGLLAHGLHLYNQFFPGLTADLTAGGAIVGDMGRDMLWYQFGGYKIQHESGLVGTMMSRPFFEQLVRRRVRKLPNVTLLDRCAVEGLEATENGERVTGVRFARRGNGRELRTEAGSNMARLIGDTAQSREGSRLRTLAADLVVDTSGRGSSGPKWLAAIGYFKPEELEVRVNLSYATRIYRRRPDDLSGARMIMIVGTPPHDKRAGLALPLEGDAWIVTLSGMHGDHCPADNQSFLDFAASLSAPDIHKLLMKTEPLSDILQYKYTASQWRRYDRVTRFPDGYLVLGDAICSFNPIYGQGMTSAAMQAKILAEQLAQRSTTLGLWREFFKKSAHVIDIPWSMAIGEDFRYPETEGPKPAGTNMINAYVARVHRASQSDPVVYGQFLRVMNLLAPPTSLFHPKIMYRVLLSRPPNISQHVALKGAGGD